MLRSSRTWWKVDDGATLGTLGSEGGIIIKDEETLGGRVTLEKDGRTAPYSITCGVYGLAAHTVFASDEDEGRNTYAAIRNALPTVIDADPPWDALEEFMADYP